MPARLWLLFGGLGCLATGGQVILVREFLALFVGNELSLGLIFGCWFLGVALGAAAGGRLAERGAGLSGLLLCGFGLTAFTLAAVAALRAWRLLVEVPSGQLPSLVSLLAAAAATVTPTSALIGLLFPIGVATASKVAAAPDRLAIGRVYVAESAGAILGGLLASVVLATWFAPLEALAALALPLLAGLAAAARRDRPALGWLASAQALGLLLLLGTSGLRALDESSAHLRFDALRTGGELIASTDTPYQHLDLARLGRQHSLFANGKWVGTFPDPYSARPRAHLLLCQHPDPRRILFLGPAFGGFAAAALRHATERLDTVELDPGIDALVGAHLGEEDQRALSDPRVQRHNTDGRRFLRETELQFDLIVSDAPDPVTASENRFFTLEFFEEARAHLAPGGVFATRVSSSPGLLGPEQRELVRGLRGTLGAVFPHVLALPGQETFLLGALAPGALQGDPATLAERYRARKVEDPLFAPDRFDLMVQAELVTDLEGQLGLEPLPPDELNRDARPRSLLRSVLAWGRRTGDPLAAPFAFFARLPWAAWAGFVLFLVALVAIAARRQPIERGAALAVGLVGALGMALELLLSYAFQALAGSLYQEIGLIVAAFMAGLVAAGLLVQRQLARRPAGPAALGATLLGLAVFTALVPVAVAAAIGLALGAARAALLALVLGAGAGTGVVFPLAGQVVSGAAPALGRAAGWLNAWDHLGAVVGSLSAGLILLPVLGQTSTCGLLALALALGGFLNLWLARRAGVLR